MSITLYGADGFEYRLQHLSLYSDNTPMIKIDNFEEVARNSHTMLVQTTSLIGLVEALFLCDSIGLSGGCIHTLVLPYLPGARQDRINPEGDVLFTLASVGELINNRAFLEVITLDVHNRTVAQQAINNLTNWMPRHILKDHWRGYTGIIAPDHGAERRAAGVATMMDKPLYFGEKVRDAATGKLSGFKIDVPKGGHYLVVDDLCDGGGTFIGLGEQIKACGAFADLYVTHGLFTKGTSELRRYYKNIYTTDSVIRDYEDENVYIVPVIERMKSV